jgi:hypothetical protein
MAKATNLVALNHLLKLLAGSVRLRSPTGAEMSERETSRNHWLVSVAEPTP